MMRLFRNIMSSLRSKKLPGAMQPVFNAIDAALFGSPETTQGAPHCAEGTDIKRYMTVVIIALMPTMIASFFAYGWRIFAIIMVSYIVGGAVEVTFATIRKHDIHEGFLVTGLIFPLTLPPTTPLWVVAVGVCAGTLFGKEMFGGTGRNIFNPALVGRLFITIAFPSIMTNAWQVPFAATADAVTSATPLGLYKSTQVLPDMMSLLMGSTPGSMGEGFRLGIIAGGLFLMITRVSDWRISLSYIATAFGLSLIGHHYMPERVAPAVYQLLMGGLLFGAMFMATDPVTSPFTRAGRYVFGIMCGLLTVLIRSFSGYDEGVMFSIVIMNALSPLIDQVVLSIKYRRPKVVTPAVGEEKS